MIGWRENRQACLGRAYRDTKMGGFLRGQQARPEMVHVEFYYKVVQSWVGVEPLVFLHRTKLFEQIIAFSTNCCFVGIMQTNQ